jgi:hypothetical protein
VVPSAPACDGVLFQHAIARGRLPGIQQAGASGTEGGHVVPGLRRHAGQALEEIEHDPFGGEERAGIAMKGGENFTLVDPGAIAFPWLHGGVAAIGPQDQRHERQSADDQRVAGDQVRIAAAGRGGEAGGRAVAGDSRTLAQPQAGQILVPGHFDQVSKMGQIQVVPDETLQQTVSGRGAHTAKRRNKPRASQGVCLGEAPAHGALMTLTEFKSLPEPSSLSLPLQALWWDGRGDWEQAHELAQKAGHRDGDWVHAYLHRKEGDRGNAHYWYTRAGRPLSQESLEEEWSAIVKALLEG